MQYDTVNPFVLRFSVSSPSTADIDAPARHSYTRRTFGSHLSAILGMDCIIYATQHESPLANNLILKQRCKWYSRSYMRR